MITGGFGMTMDLERGTMRQWVMGRDGVKRWADTDEPIEQGENLPELPTCTKSQTGDMRRCEACRETGAIHCSDPENCGGPWTVPNAEVTGA